MGFWNEIETSQIESVPIGRERTKFRYNGGPLRFQIPRGMCTNGINEYKSMYVDLSNADFIGWWRDLEIQLCPLVPFNSNLKGASLRLKVDDSVYVFDKDSKQVCPEVREGLFRGQEVSCLIDIDSTYFFNGNWGLTVRLYQIKTLTEAGADEETVIEDESTSLPKGTCAFLPEEQT